MTLQEIKHAVENGQRVFWRNTNYEVVNPVKNQWLIKCRSNNSCIGLTWIDGVTMNGLEREFFIGRIVD